MYEGVSFSQKYENFCEQRKKRKKRLVRLISECAVLLLMIVTAVLMSNKILPDIVIPLQVFATPENSIADADRISMEEIMCTDETETDTDEVKEDETDSTMNGFPVVFLDAGHGGNDSGCFQGDIMEKNINLSIAELVREKLTAAGFQVIMSRSSDVYIAKEDRVIKANSVKADVYVSIHQNSSEDKSVNGMEVWYDGTDAGRDSKRLALLVSHQTAGITSAVEREVRGDAGFHVTGSTLMPACLIETGFLSNKEERDKLVSNEYQEQLASGIAQGIFYYFYPKTLYLTFDDGPSEENTLRVLDTLKARNIKATFFLVGENVEKHPEIARRIIDEGHTIGIHCYSHDYKSLYESVDSYVSDFERAKQTVFNITGVEPRIFRFPGGSINSHNKKVYADIIEEMTNRGYIYYDWNASLEDAVAGAEPSQLLVNGVQTTLGRNKVVMLAHDVVYGTGIVLDDLLDCLPEYEIKPLDISVEPIQF